MEHLEFGIVLVSLENKVSMFGTIIAYIKFRILIKLEKEDGDLGVNVASPLVKNDNAFQNDRFSNRLIGKTIEKIEKNGGLI